MIIRLAFFALMAVGLLGFGTVAWLSSRPPASEGTVAVADRTPTKVLVLTAVNAVNAGTLLKATDVGSREMAANEVGEGYSIDTPVNRRAMIGAMLRHGVNKDEVLRAAEMMNPGEHGFLAAVLEPGMSAVSIGVDAITGAAGLIWPGDRVDLILSQVIPDNTLPIGRRVTAETVLRDVRVIAIDQAMMQGVVPDAGDVKARTITLEVTPAQAERVSVAIRIGRLSLTVRSAGKLAHVAEAPTTQTTWASDVSPALGMDVANGVKPTLRVYQGAAEGKEFRF